MNCLIPIFTLEQQGILFVLMAHLFSKFSIFVLCDLFSSLLYNTAHSQNLQKNNFIKILSAVIHVNIYLA